MPNFIRFELSPGNKQDGIKTNHCYDIADFTQEEAEEFAEFMRQTFIEHWKKRKEGMK